MPIPRLLVAITPVAITLVAASALLTTGCGSSPSASTTATTTTYTAGAPLASGGASSVYVISYGYPFQILQLSATANGSVTPLSTLTLPLGLYATCIALDASGQLYVGIAPGTVPATSEVLVYPANSTGSATPSRTIVSSASNFNSSSGPASLAVDASGNLYVATAANVSIFASGATGTATPTRFISGALTQFSGNGYITLDNSGNLYVGQTPITGIGGPFVNGALVFSSTANGNVAPTRIISESSIANGGFDSSGVTGLATDTSGNLYVATYHSFFGNSSPATYTITKYGPSATGTATPLGSITASTQLQGVHVDSVGNLFSGGPSPSTGGFMEAYGPSSSGNENPTTSTSTPNWTGVNGPAFAIK